MKAWGHIAGLLVVFALLLPNRGMAQTEPSSAPSLKRSAVIEMKGPIDDFSMRSLERRFAEARVWAPRP